MTHDNSPSLGLSIIVAMAENRVIGCKNDLPWHIPEDLRRFKALTLGKPCIMGRKTYESILARLGRPLSGRPSIVVSRSGKITMEDGVLMAGSLAEALAAARKIAKDEIMVIGGAQIYEQAIEMADIIYLTRVHQSPDGDAFFPLIDPALWKGSARESHGGYDFMTLRKTRAI